MRRLVALDLPAGPAFLAALQRAHGEGDAVFPVDRRLAAPARQRLYEVIAPTRLVDELDTHDLKDGRPVADGDAFVVATSGTTGEPKGVVLTHDAVQASALATSLRLGVDPTRDRWLACLPLAHVGGLSVLTRALALGTGLELHDGFAVDRVIRAASDGATMVSLVPTALGRLGDEAARFRAIVLGGSAPPAELPENTHVTYGLTETGSGVVYDGWPLDGVEMAIGDSGEVMLRGPMVADRYRDERPVCDEDGWLHTADGGRIAPDGHLEVFGRLDECINSGGEKIWPQAVEAVLLRDPSVDEVAVTGVADLEWGERVVALVVPVAGASPVLGELREHVRAELSAMHAPKELHLVDALPRTAIGKVARAEVAKLAQRAAEQ